MDLRPPKLRKSVEENLVHQHLDKAQHTYGGNYIQKDPQPKTNTLGLNFEERDYIGPPCHKEDINSVKKENRQVVTANYKQASRIMELEQELRMVKKESVEAVDNVLDFVKQKALLTGGGTPPDGDWLSKMKIGTEFLVRPKTQKTWILAKFMQAGIRNGNVLLIPMKGEDVTCPDSEWIWADPVEFCKFWEFKGVLLEPVDE